MEEMPAIMEIDGAVEFLDPHLRIGLAPVVLANVVVEASGGVVAVQGEEEIEAPHGAVEIPGGAFHATGDVAWRAGEEIRDSGQGVGERLPQWRVRHGLDPSAVSAQAVTEYPPVIEHAMRPAIPADGISRRDQVGAEEFEFVDDPLQQGAFKWIGQLFLAETPQALGIAAHAERVVELHVFPGKTPDIVFWSRIERSGLRRRHGMLEVPPQPSAIAFDDGAVFFFEHPGCQRFAKPVEDFRFAVHDSVPSFFLGDDGRVSIRSGR